MKPSTLVQFVAACILSTTTIVNAAPVHTTGELPARDFFPLSTRSLLSSPYSDLEVRTASSSQENASSSPKATQQLANQADAEHTDRAKRLSDLLQNIRGIASRIPTWKEIEEQEYFGYEAVSHEMDRRMFHAQLHLLLDLCRKFKAEAGADAEFTEDVKEVDKTSKEARLVKHFNPDEPSSPGSSSASV